jgi:hypothetical protein
VKPIAIRVISLFALAFLTLKDWLLSSALSYPYEESAVISSIIVVTAISSSKFKSVKSWQTILVALSTGACMCFLVGLCFVNDLLNSSENKYAVSVPFLSNWFAASGTFFIAGVWSISLSAPPLFSSLRRSILAERSQVGGSVALTNSPFRRLHALTSKKLTVDALYLVSITSGIACIVRTFACTCYESIYRRYLVTLAAWQP